MTSALWLVVAKITITLSSVLGLAWIAERLSAKWAGLLAGFPLGTAIALYFVALEQGTHFTVAGIPHTLLGFISALLLAQVYLLCLPYRHSLFWAPVAAVSAFLLLNLALQKVDLDIPSALMITSLATLVAIWLARLTAPAQARIEGSAGWRRLIIRGLFSAVTVLAITSIGHWASPEMTGAMAAFPITFFPLLWLIHQQYGPATAGVLLRYYPQGIGALLVYTTLVGLTYHTVGIGIGTLLALGGAAGYLVSYQALVSSFRKTCN